MCWCHQLYFLLTVSCLLFRFSTGRWASAVLTSWRRTRPSAMSLLSSSLFWLRPRRPPCGAPCCAQSLSTQRTAGPASSLPYRITSTRSMQWRGRLLSWISWPRRTIQTTGGTVTITESCKLWQRGERMERAARSSRERRRRKKRRHGC